MGDPYVWGAAGPDEFDCSGLVMWAYAQAGVYWYTWAQKIADTCNPADAARALACVLATAGE